MLPTAPQRIVSLCPSQTELLYALGAGSRVVGRTTWCIHPAPQVQQATSVGGTKKVNIKKLQALEPDFILCEMEENTPAMVKQLEAIAPTYVTKVETVGDALAMIHTIGQLLHTVAAAAELVRQIQYAWAHLPQALPKRTAYLIWKDPWMLVGQPTYIGSVLEHIGLVNVAAPMKSRYPSVELHELKRLEPELVLLSSEPFEFRQSHLDLLSEELPRTQLELVDGEAFSWYGSRMLPAAQYLATFAARHRT